MRDFEVVAKKAGLKLENLEKDNEGNGDFEILNIDYADKGAAISFMHNKFYSVG